MRRRVVTLHITDRCNKNCSFCYRRGRENEGKNLPFSFFYGMVPYLAEVTEQVAIGGGELYYACPEFVEEFSRRCDDYGLICNITTNGSLPERIIRYSKYLTIVSVSYDREKWSSLVDFMLTLHKLRENGIRLGVNFLIDRDTFNPPLKFIKLVDLFFMEAERVFVLYPKRVKYHIPILNYKDCYFYLSHKYKHFYVDDTTYKILSERRYRDWNSPCHYGIDIMNINSDGTVTGCSFSDKVLLKLHEVVDVLNIRELKTEKMYSCPYL